MELVIDAQVVKGYFQEVVLGIETSLTANASSVLGRLGDKDIALCDDGQNIEFEWRNVVEPEWFEPWFAQLLAEGAAQLIPTDTCEAVRRKLRSLGFPDRTRDMWYVRTASKAVKLYGSAVIITEDMDFYAPSAKKSGSSYRQWSLYTQSGPVARCLRRLAITVCCVAGYLDQVSNASC